jgi:hypothetical protein
MSENLETGWWSEIDSNSRSRWLSGERAFSATSLSPPGKPIEVSEGRRGPTACRETSNVCICPEKERAGTCVVRVSKAGADHVAIRDRVGDGSHGRVGDVRGGSRIRSHQDAHETRSRAAGGELPGTDGPLSLSSRGRCWTRTRSKPELRRTIVNLSETSVRSWSLHKLPGQDVAREVIEHGRQIEPAPIIRV